jgi:HK97 family phage portal protein
MGVWQSLMRAFGRGASAEPETGLLTRMRPWSTPPQRGSKELVLAYRTDPWLRAAARLVGSACGSVPLTLHSGRGKSRKQIEEHPLLDLLKRPNPVLSSRGQRRITQTHYDLVGDAIWVKERNNRGEVVQIVPVPPHWVRTFPGRVSQTFDLSWRDLQRSIRPEDVVWFHDPDPAEPFGRGAGLAESLADELDTDEYAAKFIKTFFYNRGTPETIASWEGANQDALKTMQADWDGKFRGPGKNGRTLFTAGKVRVERLDTTFRDMQLVELRDAQRDTIVSVWGIPPEQLGILASSNRATIEASDLILMKQVVKPRLEDFVDTLNTYLVPEFGDDLELGFVDPVPADKDFKLRATQARPSAFTDNEVRKLAGWDEATGKDEYPEPAAVGVVQMAADPAWTRSLKPRGKRQIDSGKVAGILEALRPERLTERVQPLWERRVEAWSKDALAELDASAKFDQLNPLIAEHVEKFAGDRIRGLVNDTTTEQLRGELLEGIRAGESIDDIEIRVEGVFDVAEESRAEAIARTEVLRSSNWATLQAQKASGVVDLRKWVATRDGRTRPEHAALDGKEAKLNEEFEIDGDRSLYPGGFALAEHSVNCRCTTVAVISDDLGDEELGFRRLSTVKPGATDADFDAVWRAYDAELRPWETDAVRALQAGFKAQRRDVLKALKGAA